MPGEAFVYAASASESPQETLEVARTDYRHKNLMLPKPLRRLLWETTLYSGLKKASKNRESKLGQAVDIREMRRKFRDDISGKIDLKKMQRAVQSTDYRMIYHVIIDCYETTKVMKPVAEDAFMLQAAHVVNVLNSKNGRFSNAQIFTLVPLQLVFPQEADESEERCICRLATDLDFLWKNLHLPWFDVFDVAEDVVRMAREEDRDYVEHLEEALSERVTPVDVFDFAAEILDKNETRSTQLWRELYKRKKREWREQDLEHFGNVHVFIRKWLSEAFAGVFGGNCILYVWDVLFLHGWSKDIFRQIALALLFLLKPWALRADNHRKMSKVLMEEPSLIYIGDLRKAIVQAIEFTPMVDVVNTNIYEDEDDEAMLIDDGTAVAAGAAAGTVGGVAGVVALATATKRLADGAEVSFIMIIVTSLAISFSSPLRLLPMTPRPKMRLPILLQPPEPLPLILLIRPSQAKTRVINQKIRAISPKRILRTPKIPKTRIPRTRKTPKTRKTRRIKKTRKTRKTRRIKRTRRTRRTRRIRTSRRTTTSPRMISRSRTTLLKR